jgi:hypothetical protein
VFLLANGILLYEAAVSNDPGAIGLVDDYQHNALFGAMLVLYIAGQTIGCVLLAVALWRGGTVPRWAAVAVGAFPIVALAFAPRGRSTCRRRVRGLRRDAATRSRRAVASRHAGTTDVDSLSLGPTSTRRYSPHGPNGYLRLSNYSKEGQ